MASDLDESFALHDLLLPVEVIELELFAVLKEFELFAFSRTCRRFARLAATKFAPLVHFGDFLYNSCECGYLSQLKYWYGGDERPKAPELGQVRSLS